MYSPIKRINWKVRTERKDFQDNFSQLADYEKKYRDSHQQVDEDFLTLLIWLTMS